LILELWNEIERSHINLPEDIRKTKNEEYGLVYFYRKGELDKVNDLETQVQTWS